MSDIRVCVVELSNRKYLQLKAVNTETGERWRRSAGTEDRREAEKLAIRWQVELEQGSRPETLSWDVFVERYAAEHVDDLRASTGGNYRETLNLFARLCDLTQLKQVNSARVGRFRQQLAKRKNQKGKPIAKETVARHLRNLRAALNWAEEQNLINNAPKVRMPKLTAGNRAKGRAVTAEEFDRMIVATKKRLPAERVVDWLFFLRGLWWSGLRIGEALGLSWDTWAEGISVDLSGEYGMFRIPGEAQKNGKEQLLPMAPEFEEMLRSVPEDQRSGFVFQMGKARLGYAGRASQDTCVRFIGDLGEDAGIIVSRKRDETKYATAHDLRRAFGVRWSGRVPAATLQQMMRHACITTTMNYYVEQEAATLAASIHASLGPTWGHTSELRACDTSKEVPQTSQNTVPEVGLEPTRD